MATQTSTPTFDLSKVQTDPTTGMVKTGAGTSVNPTYLGQAGYDQAVNYASTLSTPTVITSGAAQDHMNDVKTQHADIVSGISNQSTNVATAKAAASAAATAEADRQAKIKETQAQIDAKKEELRIKEAALAGDSSDGTTNTDTTVTDPNHPPLSQEGDAQDKSLKDATDQYNQQSLDLETEKQKVLDSLTSITQGTFPLSAPEQAQIDGLKNEFATMIAGQKLQNITDQGLGNIRGYQGGAAEYDPTFQAKTIGSIVTGGLNKVADLESKMAKAVADLTEAFQTKKYDQIKGAWDIYSSAAKDRMTTLQKTIDDARKVVKDAQDKQIQASRDNAISGLLAQGITDPNQIMSLLSESAAASGTTSDFTADEVGKALKNLAPNNELDKLSGATKDFFILKGQGQLPGNIASLPENQQMMAYLKTIKAATTVGTSGNKISLSDVKNLGLPISTVGMNQDDIIASLQTETPPAWFMEKLQNETKQSLDPSTTYVKDAWNTFRNNSIDSAEGTAVKDSPNYTKAKEDFGALYDLNSDELDKIATEVVNKMVTETLSYADAVTAVQNELQK